MPPTALTLVWDSKSQVSESPVFDERNNRLLFADLEAGKIMALGLADGARETWTLPEAIGSFGLCQSGRLVVALLRRVVLFDPRSGKVEKLSGEMQELPTSNFNDGKVGPDGCFWVGGRDGRPKAERQPVSGLYRVSPDGRMELKAQGYLVSNGLAWTPDGRTMFHSDSSSNRIDRWDFDPKSGNIANRHILAQLKDADGRPDGAACDSEGNYWSAAILASRLNCYASDGRLLKSIELSIPTPTMPCFVGDTLYITSLSRGMDAEKLKRYPGIGGLYKMPAPARAGTEWFFAD